jgi:peptide/nickel transport system permease protein
VRPSLAALGVLALTAAAAPWLPLRDPAAQPDGLVLAALPPLARVDAVQLAGGEVVYAHAVRQRSDGSVEIRRGRRLRTIPATDLAGPTPREWRRRPLFVLGTDGYGRDLLSRLIHGARVSLAVGAVAAAAAVCLGALVGLAAGAAGGLVDGVLMRVADVFLSVPRLFLILFLVGLWGPSLATTMAVVAATTWMAAARLVRAEAWSLRDSDLVRSAVAAGASPGRIALRHVLPAAAAPLLVEAAMRLGGAVLLEASLSFLGLGVPPPAPSWGNLLADGRDRLLGAPWIATLPGLAVAGTVVAVGRVADHFARRPSTSPRT